MNSLFSCFFSLWHWPQRWACFFFLKSKKQAQYRNDERWQWIQLKASDTANLSHTILLLLILFAPLFLDSQTTFTLQRVKIFALLYIGLRNMI